MKTFSYDTSLPNPAFTSLMKSTNSIPTQSPLSGAVTVDVRAGSHWRHTLNYQNLTGADRSDILGFFGRLNGREHRVRLPMFNETNRGSFGGQLWVKGNGQTGSVINADVARYEVTNYARRGDFISFDNCVRMVMADADTDINGDIALDIWPPIRTSPPDNTEIVDDLSIITGVYILMTDLDFDNRADVAGGLTRSSLSLTFIDDILA